MPFSNLASLFCCFLWLGVAGADRLDIFLLNITIFQSHERSLPFTTNHPEVYLSCDDGRPKVNLDQVRRTKQLYRFSSGDINATSIYEDGCVACRLRESDSTALLGDDTFGSWSMCQSDFEENGFHRVEEPGEFEIDFGCPDCLFYGQSVVEVDAPAPEPESEDDLAEAPASIELFDKEDETNAADDDDDAGVYYYVDSTEQTTFSYPDSTDTVDLLNGETSGNSSVPSNGDGGGSGDSVAAILSLCLIFLAVGIAVGVGLFWRFSSHVKNGGRPYELVEMGKLALPIKKSEKL